MSDPVISVIIPVFNAERFMEQAIATVSGQTYRDFECIVVDDGSTDSTPDILARHREIRSIRQENAGASAARNAGIRIARGEFLTFLDVDNEWFPERLEAHLEFHRGRPDLDFSHVDLEERIVEGLEVPSWALANFDHTRRIYPFAPSGLMIRREAMLAMGCYNEAFRVAEIGEWLGRARDSGLREGHLERTLGIVWIHGRNISYDVATTRGLALRALHASMQRKREMRRDS